MRVCLSAPWETFINYDLCTHPARGRAEFVSWTFRGKVGLAQRVVGAVFPPSFFSAASRLP